MEDKTPKVVPAEVKPEAKAPETKVEAPAAAPEAKPEAKPADAPKETMGELFKADEPAPEAKPKEAETVPLATYLETKKENKEMMKAIKDLQAKVEQGATRVEVSEDIAAIGEEFGVDAKFLAKLSSAIEAKAKAQAKAEREAELAPLKERERAEKIDAAFKKHFGDAMEAMPEYKEVVNAEVIKTLSLDPKNKDKTFAQIIEETYGHAITGKRTIETTMPGGGKEPSEIDYAKAGKDPEYFKTIMANPALKAEYNKSLHKRLRL